MSPDPLPDSNWLTRTHTIPFRQLINLSPLPNSSPSTHHQSFISTSSAYPPTSTTRTYGGHVFAQAAHAAALTVAPGLTIHNTTGWFLLLGDCRYPFRYVVRRVRDGGVYCLRMVEVYQDTDAGAQGRVPCFVCTVAFKRDESAQTRGPEATRRPFGHQELPRDHLQREYGHVLDSRRIDAWPRSQGMDALWTEDLSRQQWLARGSGFPGLEMRKVDLRERNGEGRAGETVSGEESVRRYRGLLFYRVVGDGPKGEVVGLELGDDDDLNLHACAHLYASDRNSLFLSRRALGFNGLQGQMGSLGHTVIFHGLARELKVVDETGRRKWFVQEAWTSNSGADRVCHNSRLWDWETGRIIATTLQDGMMRIPVVSEKRVVDGEAILEEGRRSKL